MCLCVVVYVPECLSVCICVGGLLALCAFDCVCTFVCLCVYECFFVVGKFVSVFSRRRCVFVYFSACLFVIV